MHKSYKGKILISTPDSNVDIFSKSVVLIIDHNPEGAFGLILNKKATSIVSNFQEIIGVDMDVYIGGPVQSEQLFFIVKGEPFNKFHLKINDSFFITEDSGSIIESIRSGVLSIQNIKVLMGYSGWSAHQLESEIERNCWSVVDDFPFEYTDTPDKLWKRSKATLGGKHLLWVNTPEDISLN